MKISKKHKIFIVFVLTVLMIYIISYLPKRANGGYSFTQSGKLRFSPTGMSISDLEMWSPKDCWWQPDFKEISGYRRSRGNTLGYIYSPLIYLDRLLFYPTKEIDKKIISETFGLPVE